jgi:hypothetical protein
MRSGTAGRGRRPAPRQTGASGWKRRCRGAGDQSASSATLAPELWVPHIWTDARPPEAGSRSSLLVWTNLQCDPLVPSLSLAADPASGATTSDCCSSRNPATSSERSRPRSGGRRRRLGRDPFRRDATTRSAPATLLLLVRGSHRPGGGGMLAGSARNRTAASSADYRSPTIGGVHDRGRVAAGMNGSISGRVHAAETPAPPA